MRPPRDVTTARLLVAGQFTLIVALVLVPAHSALGRSDWQVPGAWQVLCLAVGFLGLAIVLVGATALGRGLTATPLPNQHAQLRTGGLYRYARHPIYTGLLLAASAFTAASGSLRRLAVLALLVALLNVKARWEETRLAARFDGYAEYAARTPRFLPLRPRPWPGSTRE